MESRAQSQESGGPDKTVNELFLSLGLCLISADRALSSQLWTLSSLAQPHSP